MGRLSSRMQPVFYDRHQNLVSRLDDGILWDARLDLLPLSTTANAAQLRGALAAMGLTLTRASAATVQTSASEVVTSGIGVDDPRVGRYGLVIEEARTNEILYARVPQDFVAYAGAGGGGDSVSASGLARPDGSVGGSDRIDVPSGSYSRYYVSAARASGTKWTASHWLRSFSGTTSTQARFYQSGGGPSHAIANAALGPTWGRASHTLAATVTNALIFIPEDGRDLSSLTPSGIVAGARNAVHDLTQIEQGAFATEAILTTGAAATRAGERLAMADPSRVVRSGRVCIELRFVPKGLVTDYSAAGCYLFSNNANGGNSYAWINNANSRLTVRVGGVDWTPSTAIVWAVGDVVDLFFEAGGTTEQSRAWYRRNGGAAVPLGASGSAPGAWSSSIACDVMGATTSPTSSWIQRIRAYAPGRRPAWAA